MVSRLVKRRIKLTQLGENHKTCTKISNWDTKCSVRRWQPALVTADSAWLVPVAATHHTNIVNNLRHEYQHSLVYATDCSDVWWMHHRHCQILQQETIRFRRVVTAQKRTQNSLAGRCLKTHSTNKLYHDAHKVLVARLTSNTHTTSYMFGSYLARHFCHWACAKSRGLLV